MDDNQSKSFNLLHSRRLVLFGAVILYLFCTASSFLLSLGRNNASAAPTSRSLARLTRWQENERPSRKDLLLSLVTCSSEHSKLKNSSTSFEHNVIVFYFCLSLAPSKTRERSDIIPVKLCDERKQEGKEKKNVTGEYLIEQVSITWSCRD